MLSCLWGLDPPLTCNSVCLRWPGVRGALVFHQAARRADDDPGGQRGPLRRCEERRSELIQWHFNRAQRHTHLHVEHSWHSGQVSVWWVTSTHARIRLFDRCWLEGLQPIISAAVSHYSMCLHVFPVTVVSITASPLPGTCRPQLEPGLRLESWPHPESSSRSASLVRSVFALFKIKKNIILTCTYLNVQCKGTYCR